jgi:hypothetical protein
MGAAYMAVAQGAESIFFNPAGASYTQNASFMIFTSRLFGLRELSHKATAAIFPSPYGHFCLRLQTFGNAIYRENIFAGGWGYQLRRRVYYGLLCRINHIYIKKYDSALSFTIDAGILFMLSDRILLGLSASNLNHGKMGKSKDMIPQIIRAGVSYRPMAGLTLAVELDKDPRFPVEFKCGMEACPLENLMLRCGFGREPSVFSTGIGISWQSFRIDYAITTHPVLGTTHQASITIHFKTTDDSSGKSSQT